MKRFGYYICCSVLFGAAPALAQQRVDPFLSTTEGGGSFEEEVEAVKELATEQIQVNGTAGDKPPQQNRFSSSMDRLLKSAGVDPNANDSSWANFEESTDRAEENYHSSFEWQMQTENSKALDKPAPFNNGLDYVEKQLKEFDSTEQDLEKEMRQYQPGAKDKDDE